MTTQYVNEAEACDAVALISDGRLIALAPPDELRRMAIGGDVVEVETAAPFDGAVAARPDRACARSTSSTPTHLRVIVDDASTALPDVVEAVTDRGGEVAVRQRDPAVLRQGLRHPRRAPARRGCRGRGGRRAASTTGEAA